MLGKGVLGLVVALAPGVVWAADGHDQARANAYDDAWEGAWVDHCRAVFDAGAGKVDGFVLQIGDSITHSNPYSQWPRRGEGKTAEDLAYFDWSPADVWGAGDGDAASTNGWYLAAADTSGQRGMTASSGIDTQEYVSGDGNGGAAMPAESDTLAAQGLVADGGTYGGNLHIQTVAAAFSAAPFAVVMLGTNDVNGGRAPADFAANLTAIVDELEALNIAVVLSTIPPFWDAALEVQVGLYNDEIVGFAMERGLPLIDFHAEVVARQPDGAWNGTLLGMDDVHPSANGGGFMSSSDPYDPGGDAAEHCTGDAALNVGYLLRSWLTVQKMKEVRAYVVDGDEPPGGGTTGTDTGDTLDTGNGPNPPDDTGTSASASASDSTATGSVSGPPTTTDPEPTSGATGSSGPEADGGDGGGCGCTGAGSSALLLVLVAPAWRRRRASTSSSRRRC